MQEKQEQKKIIRIAIDGPAGAGKSTVAKLVADKLSVNYVDTGAMYRAVAYYMIINNVDVDSESDVVEALERISVDYKDGSIFLNGEKLEGEIRQPEVTRMAARVSAILPVRERLVLMQKEIAAKSSVLMDGRDIGTNVIKDAEIKIFLTATAEERANRRYKELSEKGSRFKYEDILEEIKKRDEQDENRAINPLRCAPDAVRLDTSNMTKEEVIDHIVKLAEPLF